MYSMPSLPVFPEFRPVTLEDKQFLEDAFRRMEPEISELNFTNVFMFGNVHDYALSGLNGNLVIRAMSYTKEPYFLPPIGESEIPKTLDAMMDCMRHRGERPAIDLAWQGFIDRYVSGNPRYDYALDRDNSDYLYKTADLITLSGRKFHDKKNLYNRFVREYGRDSEYRSLTADLVPQAIDLTDRWCHEKCSADIPSTFGETEATIAALTNLDRLSSKGGVVMIKGRVQALTLGEELNHETAVVHVEKANAEFAGLYQFIASEFLAHEFPDHAYTNREQDLGEPNLRKSKLSYNPIRMVEKFRVWPKL